MTTLTKPLTPSLDSLARAYATAADAFLRDSIFEAVLLSLGGDLDAIAGKAAATIGRPDAKADLRQDAYTAVLESLPSYRRERGPFKHYALACAKAALQSTRRREGRNLVLPDEEPLRLARLARQSAEAHRARTGSPPSRREWREAMRQQALSEARHSCKDEAAAQAQVRRLNLNQVDPALALRSGQVAMLWLDAPAPGGQAPSHAQAAIGAVAPEEAEPLPPPPAAALLEVLAREAVRGARQLREARRRRSDLGELASEIRKQAVVLDLLLKRRSLGAAAADLGVPLVTLRKWLGEATEQIRRLKQDGALMPRLEAEARDLARQRDLQSLLPPTLPSGDEVPAQRQLGLLYALASSPGGGAAASTLLAELAGHYGGKSAAAATRMLKRDIEALRGQGWPLVSLYRGEGEPWYLLTQAALSLDPGFELRNDEAQALAAALGSGAAQSLAPEARQALHRLLSLRSPLWATASGGVRSAWPVLLNGIEQGRAVDLELQGQRGRFSYSLYAWFQHGKRCYVVGRQGQAPVQALSLDAIQAARDTAEPYVAPPAGFDAQRWVFETRPWYAQSARAPVRLPAAEAAWARQRWPFIAATPAPQGAWDFDFYVEDPPRFLNFLLGEFGAQARLLPQADPSLRRALKTRLQRAR